MYTCIHIHIYTYIHIHNVKFGGQGRWSRSLLLFHRRVGVEASSLLVWSDNDEDAVILCTGTLDHRPFSLLPIPVDASGQLSPELTSSPTVQVPLDNCREEAVFEGQNMGSQAVGGDGILHTPLSSRLSPSSPSFPFRRSDLPPFFIPGCFDDGILPTPHFFTRLPYPSSQALGFSPWRCQPRWSAIGPRPFCQERCLGCIRYRYRVATTHRMP